MKSANMLHLFQRMFFVSAKEAFIKIGEHLQRVRQSDYWDTFSLYLEEEDDDPALKDDSLAEKLAKNFSEGKKKMADILETFTQKQESRGEELKENDDVERDDDEGDEDDDDEDEKEEDEKEEDEKEADEKEDEEDEDQVDLEEKEEEDEKKDEKNEDDDREISPVAETKSPDTPSVNNTGKEDEPRDSPKPSNNDSSNAQNDTLPENSSSEGLYPKIQ